MLGTRSRLHTEFNATYRCCPCEIDSLRRWKADGRRGYKSQCLTTIQIEIFHPNALPPQQPNSQVYIHTLSKGSHFHKRPFPHDSNLQYTIHCHNVTSHSPVCLLQPFPAIIIIIITNYSHGLIIQQPIILPVLSQSGLSVSTNRPSHHHIRRIQLRFRLQ